MLLEKGRVVGGARHLGDSSPRPQSDLSLLLIDVAQAQEHDGLRFVELSLS